MTDTIASLGPIMQLAFVPDDIDAALAHWTKTMGAGPFYRLSHIAADRVLYRGEPTEIDFSVLIGYWGDIQIELIEQHDDAPSIYTAWRTQRREGLHHVCLAVDDIAHARAVCTAAGARFEQEVFLPGGVEAFYVDTGGGPGTMVEVIAPSADMKGLFAMMRDAAKDWDGTDPVRDLG